MFIKPDLKNYPYIEQIEFTTFDELFKTLYKKGIYSIMVEAGSGFNSILLKEKEVDEINQFISFKLFGSGLSFIDNIKTDEVDDCIKLKEVKIKKFSEDILINGKIEK